MSSEPVGKGRLALAGGLACLLLGLLVHLSLKATAPERALRPPGDRPGRGPAPPPAEGPARRPEEPKRARGGGKGPGPKQRGPRRAPPDRYRRNWDVRGSIVYARHKEGWPGNLRVLVHVEWPDGGEEQLGWIEPTPPSPPRQPNELDERQFRVLWSRRPRQEIAVHGSALSLDGPRRPRAFWVQAFADGSLRSLRVRVPVAETAVRLILWDGERQEGMQARADRLLRAGKQKLTVQVTPPGEYDFQVAWLDYVAGLGAAGVHEKTTDAKSGASTYWVYPGTYEVRTRQSYLFKPPVKHRIVLAERGSGATVIFRLRDDLHRVRGIVFDAKTGKPIDRPSIWMSRGERTFAQIDGTKDGRFQTPLLPPGTYKLGVDSEWSGKRYWQQVHRVTVPTSGPLVFKLKRQSLSVVLVASYSPSLADPENTIRGVIRIWHRQGHEWRLVFASSMDNWRREELWGYPSGDYRIAPEVFGYLAAPQEQHVTLVQGQPLTVKLHLIKQ